MLLFIWTYRGNVCTLAEIGLEGTVCYGAVIWKKDLF